MLAFGLGTFPAMLLMGGARPAALRARPGGGAACDLAGAFIVLLGLITLARGVVPHRRACRHPLRTRIPDDRAGRRCCSHCLLPLGPRPTSARSRARPTRFCCYGCCLAFQVAHGEGEESEAAWLLIRLGIGAFLSMNVMLFSLLLYSGTFERPTRELLPLVHLLLWALATPCMLILGGPALPRGLGRPRHGAADLGDADLARRRRGLRLLHLGRRSTGAADVYFDTATMLLLLFTLGRYLEAAGRARAMRDLAPMLARTESEVRRARRRHRDAPPGARGDAPARSCSSGRASASASTASSSRAPPTSTRR